MTYGGPPGPIPVQAPQCFWHYDRQAVVPCARCNRPICPACVTPTNVGYLCPECVHQARAMAQTATAAAPARPRAPMTLLLIAANVVMFLFSVASAKNVGNAVAGQGVGSLLGGSTPLMEHLAVIGQVTLSNGQVVPYGVGDGEYYRLVTAMFMHYGLIHLGLNMWALWVLGQSMEFAFGARRFLALFLLAGLGGNVAAWLFQPGALTAGASTAIFGLFSALFVTLKKLGRDTSSVVPIIVLNLVFTFSVPGISIAGHLGGFVTGAVVAYAMLHLRPIGPGETQHQLG